MENVKGLLGKKHSELFNFYIDSMTKMGYVTE
jgi:site-specific DNA-cytosine methylase